MAQALTRLGGTACDRMTHGYVPEPAKAWNETAVGAMRALAANILA